MCLYLCPQQYVSLFQLSCTCVSHVINTICLPMLLTNQQSYSRTVGSRTDRKEGDGALLVFLYEREREWVNDEKEEEL